MSLQTKNRICHCYIHREQRSGGLGDKGCIRTMRLAGCKQMLSVSSGVNLHTRCGQSFTIHQCSCIHLVTIAGVSKGSQLARTYSNLLSIIISNSTVKCFLMQHLVLRIASLSLSDPTDVLWWAGTRNSSQLSLTICLPGIHWCQREGVIHWSANRPWRSSKLHEASIFTTRHRLQHHKHRGDKKREIPIHCCLKRTCEHILCKTG